MSTTSTAQVLQERIRAHYIRPLRVRRGGHIDGDTLLPGAVVLTEVPAPASGRRIDALVIGLTRARAGLDGFEIKVNRGDWLHELDQPPKADAWFGHTHRWWMCAPSTAIVRAEELPDGWGLMVPDPRSARRLKVVVKATTRTPTLDWPVLCEIVKKLDRCRATEIQAAVQAVREHMHADTQTQIQRAAESLYAPTSDETRTGVALAEATGLPAWDLLFALRQASPWTRQALTAVLAAARANERQGDHSWVAEQAKHLAAQHQDTATALLHAAALIEPAHGDGEQREQNSHTGERKCHAS